MIGLPPGTILQLMYLNKRISKKGLSSFIEIGSGNGHISNLLLNRGLTGIGIDLNSSACENNNLLNHAFVKDKRYSVVNDDFLSDEIGGQYDLIISCMVIEHLPDDELEMFIMKCKRLLSANGQIVFLVPANMQFWGIEDEIAGHVKRYTVDDINNLAFQYKLTTTHIKGLTYPLSNLLLWLSNIIVKSQESAHLQKTDKEKTIYTGNREVKYKTTFPKIFNMVLNPIILYPMHLLQMCLGTNSNSLVLYFELKNE